MQAKVKFSGKTALLPGIIASTPGHTPGHSCYVAASKGESIEFWGDIVHFASVNFPNQKLQLLMMSMPMLLRHNAKHSLRERKHPILVAGTFALSGVGHLRAADQGYAWVPVDYRWRLKDS